MNLTHDTDSRFSVYYQLTCSAENVESMAHDICYEQTVETHPSLVTQKEIVENVVGRVEHIRKIGPEDSAGDRDIYLVKISYWDQLCATQLPQLLNVVMGNSSLKPNIKVMDLSLNKNLSRSFPGPQWGVHGLRTYLEVNNRPLLACPLKPVGLTARELGRLAANLAEAGVDIIKDDHGLVDYSFCTFQERLNYCYEAVMDSAAKTGKKVYYFISITDSRKKIEHYLDSIAHRPGCGVLFAPFLTGIDLIPEIVTSNSWTMPIMVHPAFIGSSFNDPYQGFHESVLLGTILRLAGADLVIFPSYGGRFSFTLESCQRLIKKLTKPLSHWQPSFPVAAGGIDLRSLPELKKAYGKDSVFLIGSNLFRLSADYNKNVERFLEVLLG